MSSRLNPPYLALLWALFFLGWSSALSAAQTSCQLLFESPSIRKDPEALRVLELTQNWRQDSELLRRATDVRLQQPFAIRWMGTVARKIDPPVRAENYLSAQFVVAKTPNRAFPNDAVRLGPVEFGYRLGETFRRLGPLNYMVIQPSGKVLEVGAGSPEAIREFKYHLFGRTLSESELNMLSEINTKLLTELRTHPKGIARVREFAQKRRWPEGLHDQAGLAYFGWETVNLPQWAQRNGYTMEQMRDAGWFLLTFNDEGKPLYRLNSPDSIKIPFYSNSNENSISVWRTRNLQEREDGKKYLGWQLDRSIHRTFTAAETLYGGWKLESARGKTIVITEGEFKCLVANEATGILTVGIPGISQMDSTIINALVEAKAKEYVVVFDRDPKGKGLMRVDGVTDSQRAAYTIAKELQEAGASNVKIGVLPDVFDGAKVGIDDLILAKGPQPYLSTIQSAMSPEKYAQTIGLDTVFQELMHRRQKLRKLLESYQISSRRGGETVATAHVQKVQEHLRRVEHAFKSYLDVYYHGATQIHQTDARYPTIPKAKSDLIRLPILSHRLKTVPAEAFSGPMLIFDFVPRDVPKSSCRPGPCAELQVSKQELRDFYLGKSRNSGLQTDLERGLKISVSMEFDPRTPEEYKTALLIGILAKDFPPEEYRFERGVQIGSALNQVPLVVVKKSSDTAVALARLQMDTPTSSVEASLFERVRKVLRPQ